MTHFLFFVYFFIVVVVVPAQVAFRDWQLPTGLELKLGLRLESIGFSGSKAKVGHSSVS